MTTITRVEAWEVFDSRGDPTVRVEVDTRADAAAGRFTVPSGASTGAHEAVERRDGDDRYRGRGVRDAVAAVEDELAPLVTGRSVRAQRTIDEEVVAYDGTENLSRVGANAVLGVSGAVARAASNADRVPLYEYLAPAEPGPLPRPMVNVLSGGLHAAGGLDVQDFLVVPVGAESYAEALETVWEVRQSVRDRIVTDGHRPLVADEGGFSPPLDRADEAFELLESGVRAAGHDPSESDVAFAVDVAATHFYDSDADVYEPRSASDALASDEMAALVEEWAEKYPILSIEDPLAEDDWEGWRRLRESLDDRIQLLGDDLLVTDADRVDRALRADAANAVLVKPNQAGTLTRTGDVILKAQENGMAPVVSARSGETADTTIADVATAFGTGQIKIGSFARSERVAKYNRLLRIAQTSESDLAAFPGQ